MQFNNIHSLVTVTFPAKIVIKDFTEATDEVPRSESIGVPSVRDQEPK